LKLQDERDRVFDEETVAADMVDFLSEFREAHPEYFDVPLYVTGESYAGLAISPLLVSPPKSDT
jgi:carboxypeptidase C (cathepsin A)